MTQKEIDNFLADTKVYVNGKSRAIQERLFSLGYKWSDGSCAIGYTSYPFLFIKEKRISYSIDMEYFSNSSEREITTNEILSLELDKPKYRPFNSIEECYKEMLKHQPFGWVKGNSGICYSIAELDKTTVYFSNSTQYFYEYSLKNHFFMDGTPFGVKEE